MQNVFLQSGLKNSPRGDCGKISMIAMNNERILANVKWHDTLREHAMNIKKKEESIKQAEHYDASVFLSFWLYYTNSEKCKSYFDKNRLLPKGKLWSFL